MGITMWAGVTGKNSARWRDLSKRLCAGASLRLCKTLPDQCTGMDYTCMTNTRQVYKKIKKFKKTSNTTNAPVITAKLEVSH